MKMDERLTDHLRRVGAYTPMQTDAQMHYQAAMLDYFVNVLRAALDDEMPSEPHRKARVIQTVLYGCCPQPQDAVLRYRLAEAELKQILDGPAYVRDHVSKMP